MYIVTQQIVRYKQGDITYTVAQLECDTISDLPLPTGNEQPGVGSKAHVVADNSTWAYKSTGQWVLQNPDGTAGYTKEEIDQLIQDTKDYADGEILGAINDLDVPSIGGTTRYIYSVGQSDGKVTASYYNSDTTPTTGSTKLVQSGGVKTYVDNAKTAANNYTDTAVADKITITNILGAGTRIEATSASPLSFDDAPFTSLGRFNWLSASAPYITNCPAYIGGSAKGGLLETSFIQGGSTVLQAVYPSAGADSPSIFWQRFRYGAGTTANPYRWTNWFAFTGTEVIPANAQTTNLTSGMRSVAISAEENDFEPTEEER